LEQGGRRLSLLARFFTKLEPIRKEFSTSTQSSVAVEKIVFRKTNAQTGRHVAVTPENSAMRHLSYGRIILNSSRPSVSFSNAERETGLICLAGNGVVKTAGNEYELGRFDAIYIPRDSNIEVSTKSTVDLAEFSSDVEGNTL
jgi:5-deoxy-D-glucuronate isomerase